MFPTPLRSAAADAPFNLQSLKRFAFVKRKTGIPVAFKWLLFFASWTVSVASWLAKPVKQRLKPMLHQRAFEEVEEHLQDDE